MSSVADGQYRLYNSATGLVMDVLGNSTKDGTNIIVYNKYSEVNDAQIYTVTTRANGAKRIQHRMSGKCVDVDNGTAATGTNVSLWVEHPNPNFAGQCLTFTDTGNTKTIDGTSYSTFYISMAQNTNYVFDIQGTSSGSNVALRPKSSPYTTHSNEWCFVPVPNFESGQLYEIRSYLDPARLAVDVRGNNPANGTNVQLYGVNHTNAQKFYITEEETGKYSIRCLQSGKYIDVAAASASNNTNVQIYTDNDTRAQRWKILQYGIDTIDGKMCLLVRIGSYVTSDGRTYMLDVSAAQTAWETNVQIYEYNGTDAQVFVLYPTDGEDGTMPVPYDFGVQASIDSTPAKYSESQSFNLGWKCAKSWAGDGSNHYEYRYRNRKMSPSLSRWGNWSNWTTWTTAAATLDGVKAYLPDPFTDNYTWDQAKNSEWEFQVRCAGADGYKVLHGQYIDEVINVYKLPTTSLTEAGWTPDGLVLGLSSDYDYGTTMFNVKKIVDEDSTVVYSGAKTLETSNDGSDVISNADLLTFPSDGQRLYVTYTPGYEQHENFANIVLNESVLVRYDSGTVDVTPTFVRDGNRLIAIVSDLGEEHVWVAFKNAMYECEQATDYTVESGFKAYNVLYPMGADFKVFTEAHNTARTQWGTDMSVVQEINVHAHAFDWDGKSIYITQFTEGGEQYGTSMEAVYSDDVLDSREHSTVSFANTVKKSFTVSGVITDDYTIEDVEALVGKHVKYRSPDGGLYDVAVTNVTATVHNSGYTEVSIDLINETR